MKAIRAPNGDVVQFPDDMSDAQIAAVMQREYGTPSQVNMAQGMLGAAMGGQQAATAVPRPAPRPDNSALGQGARGAAQTLLTGAGRQLDVGSYIPRAVQSAAGRLGINTGALDPIGGTERIAQLLQAALGGGSVQRPEAPSGSVLADVLSGPMAADTQQSSDALQNMGRHVVRAFGGNAPALPAARPFGQTSDDAVSQTPWLRDQPTTAGGRLARSLGGAAPMAPVAPGSLAAKIGGTALPVLTSWGASELAPEDWKAEAGLAGGLAGGLLSGQIFGRSRADARLLGEKTPSMTPTQQQAVVDALERGQKIGMQPTLTEAIDANVPGARTAALQQYAEGTGIGRDLLGPRMAARPEQMRAIVGKIADQLAPETSPVETETAASNAAGGALDRTRGQINAAADPFYGAMRGETVPPQEWAQLQQNPAFKQGLADLRGNPVLNRDYATLPDNNVAVVNEALKRVQARTIQATPNPANPGSDATLAGAYEHQGGQVNAQMRGISPNWAQARDTVSQGRQALLTPMQEGPLGAMAGKPGSPSPGLGTMTESLFPSKPFEGQPNVTADALAAMEYEHPGVSGQVLRQYLQRQAAESGQMIAGKPNEFAPSNFSTNIAGNPLQRDTILGAASQANPQAGAALADALDTFDTTGRRLAIGSNTVDKNATSAVVESGGKAGTAILAGGSKRLIVDRLFGWASQLEVRMNQNAIAKAVDADPVQAVNILQRIEEAKGNSGLQRSLFGALVGSNAANSRKP